MDIKAIRDQVHSHCGNAYLIFSGISPILLLKTDEPLSKIFYDFFEVMGLNKRMKVRFFFFSVTFTSLRSMCWFFSKPLVSIFNTVRLTNFFGSWFMYLIQLQCSLPGRVYYYINIWHLQREKLSNNWLPERKNYFSSIPTQLQFIFLLFFPPKFDDEVD